MNIRTKTSLGFLCCLVLTVLFSCKEHIDTSNRYVFKERTIASYLSEHAQFSEYVKLLKTQKVSKLSETSVYQLMTAYGAYTCFAPTTEALQLYLHSLVIKEIIPVASWDSFPNKQILDSIRRGYVSYVINTRDISSMSSHTDGYEIRRCAVENNVTIFTALDTVRVLLDVLEEITISISTIDG